MNTTTLLQVSNQLRLEAQKVLGLTRIEQALEKFGTVNLIGSYKYDVMVEKDIDFHVIVSDFSPKLAQDLFNYAVSSASFEYVSFHDKHTFNDHAAARYASKWALDSYYFGLRLPHNGSEWQIGINFITEPQQAAQEINRLFETVTDEQREQILMFKKYLLDKGKDIASSFVYRAVLEKSITGEDELLDYLRTIGYKL